jgi:hypothetical protein
LCYTFSEMADPGDPNPPNPYPPEVDAFGDALEQIMRDRTYGLAEIAAALNRRGIVCAGRTSWTAETLAAYLAELANQ